MTGKVTHVPIIQWIFDIENNLKYATHIPIFLEGELNTGYSRNNSTNQSFETYEFYPTNVTYDNIYANRFNINVKEKRKCRIIHYINNGYVDEQLFRGDIFQKY